MPARNRLRALPDIPRLGPFALAETAAPNCRKQTSKRKGPVVSRRRGRATPRLITVPIKEQIATVVSQVPLIAPNILAVAAEIGQIP